MAKACFICTTPYQIIAATAIALEDKMESDLIVVPQFSQAEEYTTRIRKEKVFAKVIFAETKKIEAYKKYQSRLLFGAGIVRNYFQLSRIVNSIVGDAEYSKIYISSQANIGRLISLYYMERGAEIIFFDDGEGSYDNDKIYEAQGIDRIIRRLLFGRDSICLGGKRCLYFPELYFLTFGSSNEIRRIKKWTDDLTVLAKLNRICGYTSEADIHEKYILLDTIPNETFMKDSILTYMQIRDMLIKQLNEKLLIKKHPRDSSGEKEGINVYKYGGIPFEIICANSSIENKVLITGASTAVLMPKILFDTEPTVIMLNHIVNNRLGDSEKREKLISNIKELYRDKSKLIIPDSIEELKDIIRGFLM